MTRPVSAQLVSPLASVVVIAKNPLPGRVKTRLMPAFTAQEAATLAAAAIEDTLDVASSVVSRNRVLLFDGDATGWLRNGWTLVPQCSGALDDRLAQGFDALPPGPALLVGMDTPQLHVDHLAFDHESFDACIGPARDGGFWALGFRDPRQAAATIRGVRMSTDHTGRDQLCRLRKAGMAVQILPTLSDVDTATEAAEVAGECPDSRFAARWRSIRGGEAKAFAGELTVSTVGPQ